MLGAGIGLVAGIAAAAALTRLLTSILFEVSPLDPLTYATVVLGLGTVALVATWLPARPATVVNPAIALRGE